MESRHIAKISGHKSLNSLINYNRYAFENQKRRISAILQGQSTNVNNDELDTQPIKAKKLCEKPSTSTEHPKSIYYSTEETHPASSSSVTSSMRFEHTTTASTNCASTLPHHIQMQPLLSLSTLAPSSNNYIPSIQLNNCTIQNCNIQK